MNAKRQQAALHARELRLAKEQLLQAVNLQLQEQRSKGYEAQVLPQIQRLISLDSYRLRDVQKMQNLASTPQKLESYIFSVDRTTGEVTSGYEAWERRQRYEQSGIYKPARDGPPKEVDIMRDRVAETVKDTFVDLTALQSFEEFLSAVMASPDTVVDDSTIHALHPVWFSSTYSGQIGYGLQEMAKQNIDSLYEIKAALQRLITMEGEQEAANRIADNYDELQGAAIAVAIGYKDAAGSALQSILNIFLPKSIRNSAMLRSGMSTMQDLIEGQFEDYEE